MDRLRTPEEQLFPSLKTNPTPGHCSQLTSSDLLLRSKPSPLATGDLPQGGHQGNLKSKSQLAQALFYSFPPSLAIFHWVYLPAPGPSLHLILCQIKHGDNGKPLGKKLNISFWKHYLFLNNNSESKYFLQKNSTKKQFFFKVRIQNIRSFFSILLKFFKSVANLGFYLWRLTHLGP